MASPFALTGLAFGATSMAVQMFNGCITGLQIISDARSSQFTLLDFQIKLDIEIARLLLWGRNSGLSRDRLHESLKPVEPLLLNILGALARSIDSTDKLKSVYGINLVEDHDDGGSPCSIPGGLVQSLDILPNAGLIAELDRHRSIASMIHKETKIYHKIKWAVWDQAKANRFIDTIAGYIGKLNELLTESQKAAYDEEFTAMKIAILGTNWQPRGQMLRALHTATVGRHDSIAQPIRLTQLRLELEMEEIAPSPPPSDGISPCLLPIDYESIHYLDVLHSYAELGNSKVIIEWKTLSGQEATGARGRRLMKQAARLAALFQALQSQPGVYRVLDCAGYVDHRHRQPARYGLAFIVPFTASAQKPFYSLHDYLSSQEHEEFQPSLGSRFELARQLTKAFLQFHQLGWLHKSTRSHNIIFFPQDGQASIDAPYILGFDYSRPNNTTGISDKPESNTIFDLYRHPNCQGDPSESFQLRFDLFSIGLLLFEIAKWRPLSSYRDKMKGSKVTPSAFVEWLIATQCSDLEFRMGVHYQAAVLTCLRGSFGIEGDDPLDKRLKLAFFEKVVKQLNACHA